MPMPDFSGAKTMRSATIYDAEGNRVAKGTIQLVNGQLSCDTTQSGFTPTASYILSPSGQQLTEMTWSGGQAQFGYTNVRAAGQLIAKYSPNGSQVALSFDLRDWLGTLRARTDYAGNVLEKCQSLPYGNGESCVTQPYLFTGKERDSESGNDYFGARYYGSSMGRFLSPDDGSDQNALNPASWNLYSYVQNNPLTNTDPDGHSIQICTTLNDTQHCTDGIDDDAYKAAQQSKANGGLTGPSLADLQNSSTGTGEIKDSNGNVVGTVKWTADNPGIQGPQAIQAFGQIGNEGMGAVKAFMTSQAIQVGLGAGGAVAEYGYGAWKAARLLSAANKARASEIAEDVVNHAYGKHVLDRGEFGSITPNEFKSRVEDTILNPSDMRSLSNGRTAYRSDQEQMVVIENSTSPSQSTAFRPTGGKTYFDNLR